RGQFLPDPIPDDVLRARAKITSHLQAPMHPAWLRCESSKYLDMPSLSRLARRAPQHLKMKIYFCANP
ncbi:MAG: hypothetical protein PVH22_14465, partial [Desulfobacteraceae bacterium]